MTDQRNEDEAMLEQFCKDLNQAHDEILRTQGVPPDRWSLYDWPEWTPQANSIRWAEKRLGKRLSKRSLLRQVTP